ncbi:histidine kinase [Streptomyces sp. NPDC014894]|uniref:histidine kinase n=1 Tax=Streptomyces sp. NPDC014894 TaxID=3364931 RepID=UPI0036F7EDFD
MRRERTRDTFADLALWALLSGPVLLKGDPSDGGSRLGVAAGVALLGVAVLVWRRAPLVSLGIAIVLGASRSLELFTPEYSLAMTVFGYLAGRRAGRARPALIVFAGAAAGCMALALAVEGSLWAWPAQLGTLLFTVVVPWVVGRYVRQYAELVRAGWELAERMEREQRAVADRERIRERSRIAGDMHDSLGHDLALIAVRAAALEVDRTLTERQRTSAGELRRSAADATARLRDIVGVLRTGEEGAPTSPAQETVRALVERSAESGLAVELSEEGEGGPLPEMTGRAVHRVVQESLTNAAKHAPGAEVSVRVAREPGALLVEVVSGRARRAPAGPAGGGTGLVALDERVRLAGGSLVHGPGPDGGFTVTARLPAGAAGLPAAPEPEPVTTSRRELDRARTRVRRGLVQVFVVPVAGALALGLLLFGVDQYTRAQSVLERERYDEIRIGDTRAEAASRLPAYSIEGRPEGVDPEPADAGECVYYRVRKYSEAPAYRFCFQRGRLASKTVVDDVPNEEHRR